MIEHKEESIGAFAEYFPDEISCVRWLLDTSFGDSAPGGVCGISVPGKYQGYSATYYRHCCRRVFPRAGTLAAFTSVPLRTWFFAILLASNFDGRVSTDFLSRHLGLDVKVARRVALRIRLHMTALALQNNSPLEGPVYVDEMLLTAVSNERRELDRPVIIFGIDNRTSVRLFCVPDRKARTLIPVIKRHVVSDSKIVADGFASYDSLAAQGFVLSRVNHTQAMWRNSIGDTTAPIDNVWAGLRRHLEGAHLRVASDKLWTYLGQHMFILQCRRSGLSPFWEALRSFPDIWERENDMRSQIDLR